MAAVLILYGTTDGQTGHIAQFVSSTLRADGIDVDVIQAGTLDPQPEHYAGVIVAASVRGGKYQRPVTAWVRKHARALAGRPSAFISVSLGVLQKDPAVQREVAAIADGWLASVGWMPTLTKPVAGALLYTQYNWLIRLIMKRIARRAGGDTDTSRDYVYTDWHDLRHFVHEFAKRVREPGSRVTHAA